ncbi:MAG: glycoside hydrolase family 3 C-terminal domain-containing protein [Terriglobales bacterium]
MDVNALPEVVGKPENLALGQQISDDAVTLVRDNGKMLPLKQLGTVKGGLPYQQAGEVHNRVVAVVLSEDVRTESGRTLERAVKARVPDANVIYVDPRIATVMSDEILKAVDQAESVIAAVYVVPTAGKAIPGANGPVNSVALNDASGALLQAILDHAAAKTAVVAMGNPYVAQDFPAIQNYLCTFSNAGISEISAVKALFGEITIHGRLPVSIPNIAQRGAGIERPAQIAEEGPQHAHTTAAQR